MNILHLDSEQDWRGGQSQILLLSEGLKKKGYGVMVLGCCPLLINRCREREIEAQEIPIHSEFDILAAIKVARVLKRENIQIIHIHSSHAHSIGLLASLIRPTKVVLSRRVDFHIRKNPISWLKYKIKIDKIIAISQRVKRVLVEDGIDEKKIDVVYDGIDLTNLRNPQGDYLYKEFGFSKDIPIIGIVAALTPYEHKDHKNFLESASIIKENLPSAKFLIVGDGPFKREIENLSAGLNLSDSVIFTGFRTDIPQLLSIFTIFVLSSYLEGLCTSLLDAQAVGIPIVATNTGGIPEIINDGVTGLLVPPRNPGALAETVLKLTLDRPLAKRLAEAGKGSVKRFSQERMVDETEKIYFEVMNE